MRLGFEFIEKLKELMDKKAEILYVHGYNSSGGTGRALEQLCAPSGYKVHHIPIPQRADEAILLVRQYLKEHPAIRLVVGSSLGAFVALHQTGYPKLVVNPCLHPSVELPKIGASDDVAQSYLPYEHQLVEIAGKDEQPLTYALFSDHDEQFDYRSELETLYRKAQIGTIPGGKHSINDEQLKEYVLPQIFGILDTMLLDTKME